MSFLNPAAIGAGLVLLAIASVTAQQPASIKLPTSTRAARPTPPHPPDGHPDLQGIWVNNTVTPFERPQELEGKEFLTDAELAVLKQRAARLLNANGDDAPGDALFLALLKNPDDYRSPRASGSYNQFWLDDGLEFETRTSQIIDPSDGHLPPLTPEGQERQAADLERSQLHPADGPEDRSTQERCLSFGTARVGGVQARNNSFYQIVQAPGYVVIHSEMIHEARIIPIDGRSHRPAAIRSMQGDSQGRWDGSTLVIDTTNFSTHRTFRQTQGLEVSGEHVHLIERLAAIDADTIRYEVTVDDPTTWTRPWTAVTTWKRSSERMLEYACHEGNYALTDILRGARADEIAATEAAKNGSN
ncbi:MAG TPA: hypothetical protein VF456_26560 [Vicinamibacterales bacterium]